MIYCSIDVFQIITCSSIFTWIASQFHIFKLSKAVVLEKCILKNIFSALLAEQSLWKKTILFFWWNAVYKRNFGPDPLIRKQQRLESAAVTLNDISISSQLPWKIMTPSCPRMSRASFQGKIYGIFIQHWQVKRHCPGRGMEI